MKIQDTEYRLAMIAFVATICLAGCGENPDSASGIFIPDNGQTRHSDELPSMAAAIQDDRRESSRDGVAIEPPEEVTNPAESLALFETLSDPSATSPADSADDAKNELGETVLNANYFSRRLGIASIEDQVFMVTDTEDGLVIVSYNDDLGTESVTELERTIEPRYHPNCEGQNGRIQSLNLINVGAGLAVIELGCDDDIEVNVRFISREGEVSEGAALFSIEDAGRLSISADYGNIVLLSVKDDEVTWFEVDARSGLRRTLTHELSPVEGARRITGVSHHGTRALLQYSDGLVRRLSYSYRCGTTSDQAVVLEYDDGRRATAQAPFVWDRYANGYVRYLRVDSEHRIEALPWNFNDDKNTINVDVLPQSIDADRGLYLILSAEGPRLVLNEYSDDQFTVSDAEGRPEFQGEKRLHGSVVQAWSVLDGGGSMLLLSGRCNDYLHMVDHRESL